jgi:hypothetical protein
MNDFAVADVDAGMEEGVCAFVTKQHQVTYRWCRHLHTSLSLLVS